MTVAVVLLGLLLNGGLELLLNGLPSLRTVR